jgi:hypothetical protein
MSAVMHTEEPTKLTTKALRRLDLTFDGEVPAELLRGVPGVMAVHENGHDVQLVVEGSTAEVFAVAVPYGVTNVVSRAADLRRDITVH